MKTCSACVCIRWKDCNLQLLSLKILNCYWLCIAALWGVPQPAVLCSLELQYFDVCLSWLCSAFTCLLTPWPHEIVIFWNGTQCHWVNSSWYFEDRSTFRTLRAIYLLTQYNIPENLDLQQHQCENLHSHIITPH